MSNGSQTAIVTGSAQGIGRGIAERLGHDGFHVALWDKDGKAAGAVARSIQREGGDAHAVEVDVTDLAQVKEATAALVSRVGRIDVLVNNAGGDSFRLFTESTQEHWNRVIALNYGGVLNTCSTVVPLMSSQKGGGRVVQIASDCAKIGCVGQAVYAGAKSAVIAFSRSLARETAPADVKVNVVCPGSTDTPTFHANAAVMEQDPRFARFFPGGLVNAVIARIPLGRMGQPADVAGTVAFLVGNDSGFLTGQVISVDGGETMY